MRNRTRIAAVCGTMLLAAGLAAAQNDSKTETKYFHLDFAVKDLDGGRVVTARHYTTTAVTGDVTPLSCTIRTGSKVPVQTSSNGPSSGAFTYLDIGVNIDCRSAREIGNSLAVSVAAELSDAASTNPVPVIRQTKWSSNVIVPIGKPTVIFSSDDVASKGQLQLELTATPIPAR